MSSPMHLYVFVTPYKPIAGLIPPMSKGEATWPATSVSLITGERDAVLIDAALTTQDAKQIVKWVEATGKNLTTIYITHGHGDHFFGLNPILSAFPEARVVTAPSTIVHIPDLNAVIAGDVAYNGIHPWLAFTDHDKRMRWIASVEQVEALDSRIVVAGHKRPDAPDDDPAAILGGTKAYLRDFERALAGFHSAQGLVDQMMAVHGDLGNPYTLWTAAQAVFEQSQGASS